MFHINAGFMLKMWLIRVPVKVIFPSTGRTGKSGPPVRLPVSHPFANVLQKVFSRGRRPTSLPPESAQHSPKAGRRSPNSRNRSTTTDTNIIYQSKYCTNESYQTFALWCCSSIADLLCLIPILVLIRTSFGTHD